MYIPSKCTFMLNGLLVFCEVYLCEIFFFCRVQKEVGVAETDIQATLDRVQNLLQEQADIRSVNLPI